MYALEYDLYCQVRDTIAGAEVERIQKTAKAVAHLDVFASLALVAERNNYVRPNINEQRNHRYQGRTPSGGGEDDSERYVYRK